MGWFLTSLYATHAGIRTSLRSTIPSEMTSPLQATLPYHSPKGVRDFGVRLKPRYVIGAGPLDQ